MEIQKVFETLDYIFLFQSLKNFVFGQNVINWIKTLLKYQKWSIIKEKRTTPYSTLHGDAR